MPGYPLYYFLKTGAVRKNQVILHIGFQLSKVAAGTENAAALKDMASRGGGNRRAIEKIPMSYRFRAAEIVKVTTASAVEEGVLNTVEILLGAVGNIRVVEVATGAEVEPYIVYAHHRINLDTGR